MLVEKSIVHSGLQSCQFADVKGLGSSKNATMHRLDGQGKNEPMASIYPRKLERAVALPEITLQAAAAAKGLDRWGAQTGMALAR